MGIKIKMIREGEPHYYFRESVAPVPVRATDYSDLVSDPRELAKIKLRRQVQSLIREWELEEIKRKYLP